MSCYLSKVFWRSPDIEVHTMAEFGDFISALGEFGLYQKWLVLLLSLPLLLNPFQMIGQVFIVVDVPHYCNTSWIRAVGPNLTEEEQLNLTLPRGADGAYEQCSMYSPVDWDLGSIVAYGLNATEKCSSGWVYPSAQQPSLLTEVCKCLRTPRGRAGEGMDFGEGRGRGGVGLSPARALPTAQPLASTRGTHGTWPGDTVLVSLPQVPLFFSMVLFTAPSLWKTFAFQELYLSFSLLGPPETFRV